jgi:low temperature requirement protein LtrA
MNPEPKRASWIELFYDVAYVALVAQLTYLAAEYHDSVLDFVHLGIIGYAIFVAWWSTTANRNLQPTESGGDKLIIQIQMVGAFFLSIFMTGVFAGDYQGFFLTFGAIRLLQVLMMTRMYWLHPETRPKTYNIVQGFSIAAGLWLSAGLASPEYYLILAMSALLLDILIPLTRGKGNTRRYLNVHHLQERLGLFLMLVIGESMIVVALSNSVDSLAISPITVVFSGVGMMIALWWLYFEHSDQHVGTRPSNLFLFLHAHGFLFGSIILISVAYKLILARNDPTLSLNYLLIGSLGIVITLITIRSTLHKLRLPSAIKVLAIFAITTVVAWLGYENSLLNETVVAVTSVFLLVALLDRLHFFSQSREPT